jgi:hypothetical protein
MKTLLIVYLVFVISLSWIRALDRAVLWFGARERNLPKRERRKYLARSLAWTIITITSLILLVATVNGAIE